MKKPERKPRTRRVVTRSGAAPRGYHPSLKSHAQVPCESSLERDALQRFELDPGILAFRAHQSEVTVVGSDGTFTTYPDFEITTSDGETKIVEVKPEGRLQNADVASRLEATRRHYAAQGIEYLVLTERELRNDGVDQQINELIEFRKPGEQARLLAMPEVTAALRPPLPVNLEELAEALGSWRTVKGLIANDILAVDIGNPLEPTQPVRLH